MPISSAERVPLGKSLTLKMDNGVDEKGKPLYISKTFSNINRNASDADVLNSANVLESLQNKAVVEVIIEDRNVLVG